MKQAPDQREMQRYVYIYHFIKAPAYKKIFLRIKQDTIQSSSILLIDS